MTQHAQHQSVSVAIVDNDRMALMALSSLLPRAGFTVTWTAQLGAAAIQRCIRVEDRPNVLLVDMALTDMTGIDVCQAVHRWAPTLPMIGVTAYDPDVYRNAAISAGATTVISKDDIAAITTAIRTAVSAGSAVSVGSSGSNAHNQSLSNQPDDAASSTPPQSTAVQHTAAQPARSFALSAQQTAIMRGYADGRSTDEIAAELGISKGTIFSQVARIREKLHARDRDEAVALCRRYLRM